MSQLPLISTAYEPDPDRCAFPVFQNADGRRPVYPCPDALWRSHYDAWIKAGRRQGFDGIAEPFPAGHCCFKHPVSYGMVRRGETRRPIIRRALRHSVRAMLNGWDRDLLKTPDGRRQLARIVHTTVDAQLQGKDTGAAPFVACIYAGI